MDTFVELPYGGPGSGFYVSQLVDHIRSSGRGYIIQGQQECRLEKHTKPHSLDVWLRRNCTDIKDTKQAVNSVIDALIATGQFTVSKDLLCPDSGRRCKGLKLLPPSDTTTDYSSHTEPYSRRNISTRSSHRASGIVVTREKLAAAGALYARLEGWQTMAALLDELRSAYPSNRDLKAYSTNCTPQMYLPSTTWRGTSARLSRPIQPHLTARWFNESQMSSSAAKRAALSVSLLNTPTFSSIVQPFPLWTITQGGRWRSTWVSRRAAQTSGGQITFSFVTRLIV
jgi:hypothetical protein